MRRVLALSLLLGAIGCGKAHRPSKGFVADEMNCKRGGLRMSEVFEEVWVDPEGTTRLRYRVGASCTKPKHGPVTPIDVWQECHGSDDGGWNCGEWQTGKPGGVDVPAATYLDAEERGR